MVAGVGLLGQFDGTEADPAISLVPVLVGVAVAVLTFAGIWAVFSKAGEPGWAAIVPIWNVFIVLRIAERPWWWFLLLLIPFVNLVVLLVLYIDLARAFGKGAWFGVGLVFLGFLFFPILGFGDSRYVGTSPAGRDQIGLPSHRGEPGAAVHRQQRSGPRRHRTADLAKRMVRMVLLLWWAVLVGGFLFFRSVDPVAVEDQKWVDSVALTTEDVPGWSEAASGSAAGIRAGLRDELGKRAEKTDGGIQVTIDTNNALVQCRSRAPTGLWERLRAGLLGVDDPGNADVTAEAYRAFTAGPQLVAVSDALTFSSEAAAEEGVSRATTVPFMECVSQGMAGDALGGRTPVQFAGENVSFAMRLGGSNPTPEGLPFVDLVVLQRGRAVVVLGLAGKGATPPPEQHQAVVDRMAQRMSTAPSG